MVVVGSAATHNEKEVKRRYPVTIGLIAGTTKQEGTVINLVAQNSTVPTRNRIGLG